MKHLFYLNKYFLKYKWHVLLGIVFVSLSNYFRALQPQIIREALDLVIENISLYQLNEGFSSQAALFKHLGTTLFYFGLLVIALAMMMGLFMYFMRQTIIVMSRLVEYDLRKEVFQHYEDLDTAFYKRNNTGDLMARITEDVSKVRMYIGPAVLYAFNLISLFIMVIYAMVSVSPELTMYTLLPLPFLSISIYYVSNLINKKSEIIQTQLANLNSISQEVYSGIRVVKSYVQQPIMARYFGEQCEQFKTDSMALAQVNALFFPLMMLLIGISTIVTVYTGGLLVVKGSITPGNIAEFVIYVNMLTWPVTAIGWIASIVQQAAASQKRINEFLEQKPSIINQVAENKNPFKGHIAFDKVDFTYPDTGIEALKNVSFELLPGQKLAIVGKTGAGKTTLADLLVRLYDVSAGEIRIDGQPIQSIDLANLRKRIGYVPQDLFLFSDTIADNVTFGKPDASRAEVEEFTKYAAVYEDIAALPNDFDTMVGERGVTLSGGQKQRITIARALIKRPDIVILDDCLSAVDTSTEQQILGYLDNNLADKTTIIITHRIYGLLQFDKIIVVDNNTISEVGTHEELLKKGGFYAQMYETQRIREAQIKS